MPRSAVDLDGMPGSDPKAAPSAHNASRYSRAALYLGVCAVGIVGACCLVLSSREDAGILEPGMGSEALAGSYYAVTKPKAFNFNRFISKVWFYDGRAASRTEEGFLEKIAMRHHYKLQIHRIPTFKDNEFRAALFSEDIRCMVFPPLVHFPGLAELARKDLRGYVSAGNNLVFVGSYEWLSVMNDIFGFQLMSSYADGPYYRNDRNVKGTPFQWSRSMLEQPDGSIYGVKVDSIPMDGACMFDTMGTCVVFYIKYNLGTICYVSFTYDTPYGIGHWDQILHGAMMM